MEKKRKRRSFMGQPCGGLNLLMTSGALFAGASKPLLLFMPGGGQWR
jgi:hypothetical protein